MAGVRRNHLVSPSRSAWCLIPEGMAENKSLVREFRTDFSLAGPGMAASFKVYVILTTENEAGSEEVTIERPA